MLNVCLYVECMYVKCMYVCYDQRLILKYTINIIPGKKSASWQLVAIVMVKNDAKWSKNDVKLPKSNQNERKNLPYRQG